MPLSDGATFGRFRILGRCGRGGMGAVYRAYEARLDRTVAVKVIASELVGGQGALDRFRREARTIATLEHPHIVPIYDYGVAEGQPWISMRLLAGGLLARSPIASIRDRASSLLPQPRQKDRKPFAPIDELAH